jgi:HSP20 family protein
MRIVRYSYPNSRRPVISSSFPRAPWPGFETEIDQLFETALGDFAGAHADTVRFPVDLFEDKERTYVRAELPGVNREDISVEVVDGYLTLSATRKTPASDGRAEESFSFNRSLELPEEVQADQISAAYENGILTVTLPKRVEAQPRKITINVK